jgi:hypothetical protein
MYFPYIAVNKTKLDIKLIASYLDRTIRPFTSIILRPISPKMQVMVEGYDISFPFEITTIGVSGEIELVRKKKYNQAAHDGAELQLMEESLDYKT